MAKQLLDISKNEFKLKKILFLAIQHCIQRTPQRDIEYSNPMSPKAKKKVATVNNQIEQINVPENAMTVCEMPV